MSKSQKRCNLYKYIVDKTNFRSKGCDFDFYNAMILPIHVLLKSIQITILEFGNINILIWVQFCIRNLHFKYSTPSALNLPPILCCKEANSNFIRRTSITNNNYVVPEWHSNFSSVTFVLLNNVLHAHILNLGQQCISDMFIIVEILQKTKQSQNLNVLILSHDTVNYTVTQ